MQVLPPRRTFVSLRSAFENKPFLAKVITILPGLSKSFSLFDLKPIPLAVYTQKTNFECQRTLFDHFE